LFQLPYIEQHEDGNWPPSEPPDDDFKAAGGRETWAALTSAEGLNGYKFIEAREDFEALARD